MAKKKEPVGDNILGMVGGFVVRIERLEEEKAGLATDIKDVYGEAKAKGLEVKGLRALVAKRRRDEEKQKELETLVRLYEAAMAKSQETSPSDRHKWEAPQ